MVLNSRGWVAARVRLRDGPRSSRPDPCLDQPYRWWFKSPAGIHLRIWPAYYTALPISAIEWVTRIWRWSAPILEASRMILRVCVFFKTVSPNGLS